MEAVNDRQEKLARPHPVHHAVVEGAREPADIADDDLAVAHDGARPDAPEAEDPDKNKEKKTTADVT